MNQTLLRAYYGLPYPLKVTLATLRGAQLNRWRYGPETDHLMAEALERESWSRERWAAWQQERLAFVLHRAATQVPYYREQWAARRAASDRAPWEYLENWPILTKEALRHAPEAFLADDTRHGALYEGHTSGTTGATLRLFAGRDVMRHYWALVRARRVLWNGLSPQDPWAIVGGQLVTAIERQRPPFWVWNAASQELYLSSYHLMPTAIAAYVQALRHYNVRYLVGYASSLYSLAYLAREKGIALPHIALAVSNAEPLYDYQRQAIVTGLGCRVQDTYGMGEMACAASECTHGRLHLWPEVGFVEVLDRDEPQPLPRGQVGRLVCTGLINTNMMLIRYQVGDTGALAPQDSPCACGRAMPHLAQVEGRLDDVVITPDGRRVGRLDPVFKSDLHIQEAQIVQEQADTLTVRLVPGQGFSDEDGRRLIHELSLRVGDMHISLEPVEHIERGANGKFRAVVSRLGR